MINYWLWLGLLCTYLLLAKTNIIFSVRLYSRYMLSLCPKSQYVLFSFVSLQATNVVIQTIYKIVTDHTNKYYE